MTIPRCLVAGVDASPESLAALELALELADRLGARLVVVHAVGLLEEGGYRPRPDLGAIVADARQRVGAGGAVVDPVYEDGPPPDVLLRVAEREIAGALETGCEAVQLPLGRHPVEATDAHVDGMDGPTTDQLDQLVADLLQLEATLHHVSMVGGEVDDPVVAEEVGPATPTSGSGDDEDRDPGAHDHGLAGRAQLAPRAAHAPAADDEQIGGLALRDA